MTTDTTAMQDLLSICETNISHETDAPNDKYSKGCIIAFQYIKEKIETKLLSKEKEQIVKAYQQGMNDGEYPALPGMGEIYYENAYQNTHN